MRKWVFIIIQNSDFLIATAVVDSYINFVETPPWCRLATLHGLPNKNTDTTAVAKARA